MKIINIFNLNQMVIKGLSNSRSNRPQIACHLIQESFHANDLTNKYLHYIVLHNRQTCNPRKMSLKVV